MPDREQPIVTRYDPKPTPVRLFDWVATFNDYEPTDPVGCEPAEQDAVNDLREQIDD